MRRLGDEYADIRDKIGRTQRSFDADTGRLLASDIPTGEANGDTITTWLLTLHMAAVGSMPVRILIALLGAGVAMLSVTEVGIWLKKRRAAQGANKLPAGQEKAQRP